MTNNHKHYLHELLKQDQEPFHLHNYIANHQSLLKTTTTTIKPIKRKHIKKSTFCLFSFHDSPDVHKSPLKSPVIKSPFHIPSKTASMLLDAAMRIQKHKKPKPKPDSFKNAGFGLFGSFFKRLKDRRTRIKRREISLHLNKEKDVAETCCLYENKDIRVTNVDFETSCSSSSTPSSPFRFSLEKSPSSGHRTPEFLSPVTSPVRQLQQDKNDYETEKSQEVRLEEEDKEQCSPVSVLDPMLEDDEEEHDIGITGYDLECSYANVQRTKDKLLRKLHRFEKLAKLDPVELEKHISEQEQEQEQSDDCIEDDALNVGNVPPTYVKRLVLDLIAEEMNNRMEHDVIVRRVIRRLELWEMVESNTIDMMVEFDFNKEKNEGWRRYNEEKIRETGMDIEVSIFGVLTEELAQELCV
ncbi:uncharacterized protein [Rutidosis leptorrhynchoides]|uniref:uncharacterized protein n=1 Tax=Rutidosis leptorrhynchoides TaxID=125765 RepID=UPI003A9A1936